MVIISEIKLLDFFVNELKFPEIKAREYIIEIKKAEERLEEKVEKEIEKKIEDKKGVIVAEIDTKFAAMETKIAESKADMIKWMFIFIMGQIFIQTGLIIIILKIFFHQ